ncbi:4'-phosphopantetheinyl transferase family protein [Arenimonas sp.]|jgi:4'-phosphopantetheinyl transferase EntD|uniref:4'-phosphopantetheinyl transferase family protein n=1 Tax=Arenimonas sp. TaxID=1872635 RepID=UPI0037BFC542
MSIDLNGPSLQLALGAVCTTPILLEVRDLSCPAPELSASEENQYAGMSSEKRRAEFRIGRAALKAVLAALGKSDDTASVVWPNTFCSLSHSHGYAVAVGLADGHGIGIDLQLQRTPPFKMAERILADDTLEWWRHLPESLQAHALQRFWTVNEAVYKACPVPQPAYFRNYRMADPTQFDSVLSIDGTDYRFDVHTLALADGFLSLALRV